MKHIKYPSIGQFRNLVKDIQHSYGYSKDENDEWFFDHSKTLPTLMLHGSIKVHGTCSGCVIKPDGTQYPESKNNVISIENDNAGFAAWHHGVQDTLYGMRVVLELAFPEIKDKDIVIFGEWSGGNIQKNVGVTNFKKFFYIFGVKVIENDEDTFNYWLKDYPILESISKRIFDKRHFEWFEMEIDFNNPQLKQNDLIELTNKVEEFCPVAKRLMIIDNIDSIDCSIGEGVVWEHITDNGELLQCKIKGKKHSSSNVKVIAEVDVEKLNSIIEFVDYVCTESRLLQMFKEICDNNPDRKLLGKFIKAVSTDVIKEESDTLSKNDLTMKDVGGSLSKRAREWFFEREEL